MPSTEGTDRSPKLTRAEAVVRVWLAAHEGSCETGDASGAAAPRLGTEGETREGRVPAC